MPTWSNERNHSWLLPVALFWASCVVTSSTRSAPYSLMAVCSAAATTGSASASASASAMFCSAVARLRQRESAGGEQRREDGDLVVLLLP